MRVSIVIPAHDAAGTLSQTLDSLLAQNFEAWEAIVVDDGSEDATADIAVSFAASDKRVRTVSQTRLGACVARNAGTRLTKYNWVLFLDSDDWIAPDHLDRMTRLLESDPTLSAVTCGWASVAPDGRVVRVFKPNWQHEPFRALTQTCPFPLHACLVRRDLVQSLGGFDPVLSACQDWDLWQRVARTGARFGATPEVLAFYRLRSDSVSTDASALLAAGLDVIARGHSRDVRVSSPALHWADGMPAAQMSAVQLYHAAWVGGLLLGRGEDPLPVFKLIHGIREPALDPTSLSDTLYDGILNSTLRSGVQPTPSWRHLYDSLAPGIVRFLDALEALSRSPSLTKRTVLALERLVFDSPASEPPLTLGTTHCERIEVTEALEDLALGPGIERLQALIELEGTRLGTVELPVFDGVVDKEVLADAIAAEFAWQILARFFAQTLYDSLRVEHTPGGVAVWRGDVCLHQGAPAAGDAFQADLHDLVGWTVFLQEVWGRPDWPLSRFYEASHEAPAEFRPQKEWLAVEVGGPLPDVQDCGEGLTALLTVGGISLGLVNLPSRHGRASADDLVVTLTTHSGFELCRAAVREGLIGRPLAAEPPGLRARLAEAARLKTHAAVDPPTSNAQTEVADDVRVHTTLSAQPTIVLARRLPHVFDSSVSRRARLPAAAAPELIESAKLAAEPIVQSRAAQIGEASVHYAPHLVRRHPMHQAPAIPPTAAAARNRSTATRPHDRHHFENVFAARRDPWQYIDPYESTKYAQTLTLLPRAGLRRGLEIGCAEGHFTVQLAPRVRRLIAADISRIALSRAAVRCAGLDNVEFVALDLGRDPLPGMFDLIVCSEVLYFLDAPDALQAVAQKLADALEPGGFLLSAHANLAVDEPNGPGFDWDLPFGAKVIGETLETAGSLRLAKELCTPLYRISLLQKEGGRARRRRRKPQIIKTTEMGELPPRIAEQVLWQGGRPRGAAPSATETYRLPILLYHRVASSGPEATARYRIAPEALEEQLRYLHDVGFYSVSLAEWVAAAAARRPLSGRAIAITFDDGYRDFLTQAWPLLKPYGFTATVFVVTDEIAGSNRWDQMHGEEVPLLSWSEIRRLRDEGVEFGSHSASHRPLTALSPTETVSEAARSRAILTRELGAPPNAFAYPYGDTDRAVQHLVGACGYLYGLSCRPAAARFYDSPLALPRIEISGSDDLAAFVSKIGC